MTKCPLRCPRCDVVHPASDAASKLGGVRFEDDPTGTYPYLCVVCVDYREEADERAQTRLGERFTPTEAGQTTLSDVV